MAHSFKDFYQNVGIEDYPFRDRTAEKEKTRDLFIQPPNYAVLEDILNSDQTVIISGNRGTGKTILLSNLKPKTILPKLVSYIDNYESVSLTDNKLEFYSLILQNIIKEFMVYLAANKNIIKNISKEDKIFLSFLILKYSESISDEQLYSQIENVQLNWFKKFVNKASGIITLILNCGSTAITNFGNELLTKHFGPYLPSVDEGAIRKIIPDIHFKISNEFKSVDISYSLFNKSTALVKKAMGTVPSVLIDRLDEDTRLKNDAEQIANFIKDLVCDSNLLLNGNVQLLISVWQIPFSYLGNIFRTSKNTIFDIDWTKEPLEVVLNRRIWVYSNKKIDDYKKMFFDDVSNDDINQIFILSNANPRDLWIVFDEIFKAQFKIDSNSKLLTKLAVETGFKNFVQNFEFYEYYPRKTGAQKNSNDVYSYIGCLLKLKQTDEFTNAELRAYADSGGSTTNYITGMMNIGLVKKTDAKRAGGSVIYKVRDPKISFAIYNQIDITRD